MTTNANTTTQTAAVAEPGAHVAPEKATSTRKASKKQSAPNGRKAAKTNMGLRTQQRNDALRGKEGREEACQQGPRNQPRRRPPAPPASPREFSKKAIILDLLHRKGGATMAEIAKSTGWQNHSIRGFVSGTLTKKMGLAVESSKNEAGERTYRITGK